MFRWWGVAIVAICRVRRGGKQIGGPSAPLRCLLLLAGKLTGHSVHQSVPTYMGD